MSFASVDDIVQAYTKGQQAVIDLFLEQIMLFREKSLDYELRIQKLEHDIDELSIHVKELENRLGTSSNEEE